MATSNLVVLLLFFSLQLLVTSHARSLSDLEPKTTAIATILLPIHKPDSFDANFRSTDNDTGPDMHRPSVPLTRVTFRHIGHLRFPLHRFRCSHVVRSRLGQRLFDDGVILLHERYGGFGRRSHDWNKIEGRQPFRVYFGKPSFEVWRNGMKLTKPYVEVDNNSQSHHRNEKVKGDEGVLRKIRKFLTQF